MIRARLLLVLAIVLGMAPFHGGDRHERTFTAHEVRTAPLDAFMGQAATPAAGTPEPLATPVAPASPVVTTPPAPVTPEPTAVAETGVDAGAAAPVEVTGDTPSRLVDRGAGPLTLWILLVGTAYTVQPDGTCGGTGTYDVVQPGGVVNLLDAGAGAAHIESVMIEAGGKIYLDTVLERDVCAYRVDFTRVPPGTTVLVDVDRVVVGRFDHTAAASDTPPAYVLVVGAGG